jgi:hypothetical protein
MTGGDEDRAPGWAIRLEAKLDVALAQHGARLDEQAKDLVEISTRLDRIEDRPVATPEGMLDHESRLRTIEGTNYITGKALAAALLTTLSIAIALLAIFDRLAAPAAG